MPLSPTLTRSAFAAGFSRWPCPVCCGEAPEQRPLLQCLRVLLPAGGFVSWAEVSWCERLTSSSQEIVRCKNNLQDAAFPAAPVSQQPLCQSRWEIGHDLETSPRSAQKSIKKHLLCRLGSSCRRQDLGAHQVVQTLAIETRSV